jgi:hypothetical protein
MNYFFVHLGEYPSWLHDSIYSVKKVDKTAKVFLCGDSGENISGAINLNLKDIRSNQTFNVMDSELWKYDSSPLWRTSIYRIFILLDMMNYLNAEDFVHFDSDVILFEDFETIKGSINHNNQGLHITRCNDSELVFGYSYCNSYNSLSGICSFFYKAVFDLVFLKSLITNFPNEMQILNGIQKRLGSLIYELPTIPSKDNEYIFDPSSYGQYLYGTHAGEPPGWTGNNHTIGRLINDGNLQVSMEKTPLAILNGVKSKIVNLHIHCKKTKGVNSNV